MVSVDQNQKWLLWLAFKIFGEKSNLYLTFILEHSIVYSDFEAHVYLDLLEIEPNHPNFYVFYTERKRLLSQLSENIPLISGYCEKLEKRLKDKIFYLTDGSEQEKVAFLRCLNIYDYTDDEWERAISNFSPSLSLYLQEFVFDEINTKIPVVDSDFRTSLTSYFKDYKIQKLTNRIEDEFLKCVDLFATSRPYNKLLPRSSILSSMEKKNTQLFFFDALGVEYLSFILAKCQEYGLISEVFIGHCELPSITSKNKEFLQHFSNWRKIDNLDEIKHHSQIFNYETCEYPLHLFAELDTIDLELRKIQSLLIQKPTEQVLIVSDHGASRLAVRYEHESLISLEESGKHSGRCCPIDTDPQLPFATYEDGFSILANYERFKGGRRANVEVHGGASLEEVIIPVISLTIPHDNIELCFMNPVITLKPHTTPELTLYSNIPLQQPRLFIDGEFYNGEFAVDQKHTRFELPKLKRKGIYHADIYDGNKNLSISLSFEAQKQTREIELF